MLVVREKNFTTVNLDKVLYYQVEGSCVGFYGETSIHWAFKNELTAQKVFKQIAHKKDLGHEVCYVED